MISKYSPRLYILILLWLLMIFSTILGLKLLSQIEKIEYFQIIIIVSICLFTMIILPLKLYFATRRVEIQNTYIIIYSIFKKNRIKTNSIKLSDGVQYSRAGISGEYFVITTTNQAHKFEKAYMKNYDVILLKIREVLNTNVA